MIALGHFSDPFLSGSRFEKALLEVQTFMLAKFQMIYPAMDKYVSRYYSLVRAHVAISNKTLQRSIEIPLKSFDRYFEVYKLAPIPTFGKNLSFTVYVKPPHKYLAISSNKQIYLPMEPEDLLQCQDRDIIICPPNIAIR